MTVTSRASKNARLSWSEVDANWAHLAAAQGLLPNVKDPSIGAVGDGVTDDTAAIQAALTTYKHVFLPLGVYKLATPLLVSDGMGIWGVSGTMGGFSGTGSYLKPTTVAIKTANYNNQYSSFDLHNVGINGGTLAVDLGLFHHANVTDCWFSNPSVGALVIVRGEKQNIENIRVDATSNTIFGMSLGRYQESGGIVASGGPYNDAFFGAPGAWFDRASVSNVFMQGSSTGVISYGIKSNNLSGTTIKNFVVHGVGGGEISVLYVATAMQQCTMIGSAPDSIGSTLSPATAMFDLASVKNCEFLSVSPQFSGNNHYTYGFKIGTCFWSTWENCRADGDNSTYYGFYFSSASGQIGQCTVCSGAYYHANANQLIRNQIAQSACDFSQGNNGSGSSDLTLRNQDMCPTFMADTSGTGATTAIWAAIFATGSGGFRQPFRLSKEGAVIPPGSSVWKYSLRATIADAGTVTPTQHETGYLFQDASAGNVTMTTATGTDLDTQFPHITTGYTMLQHISSNHATNTSTISGGTGVTLVGSGAVTQTGATFILEKTGAATYRMARVNGS